MTHKDPSINHLSSLEGDATVKSTRPKWNEEMFKELALYVGKIINKWCNNETPLEDCVESATKVLQWHIHDDGYQIAKELEQEGFNSDSQLVEELDDVFHEKNSILERHIKQWTIDSKIHLLLPINIPSLTGKLNSIHGLTQSLKYQPPSAILLCPAVQL